MDGVARLGDRFGPFAELRPSQKLRCSPSSQAWVRAISLSALASGKIGGLSEFEHGDAEPDEGFEILNPHLVFTSAGVYVLYPRGERATMGKGIDRVFSGVFDDGEELDPWWMETRRNTPRRQ